MIVFADIRNLMHERLKLALYEGMAVRHGAEAKRHLAEADRNLQLASRLWFLDVLSRCIVHVQGNLSALLEQYTVEGEPEKPEVIRQAFHRFMETADFQLGGIPCTPAFSELHRLRGQLSDYTRRFDRYIGDCDTHIEAMLAQGDDALARQIVAETAETVH